MNCVINNLRIIVNNEVIHNIKKYYHSNMKYETGGVLLGKFNRENRIIEITEVYEIKSNLFSRILYKRSARKAQKIINQRWRETEGRVNYIGEWHTHPNMPANPSSTDLKSLKEISQKVGHALLCTILIIVGRDEKINLIVQNDNVIKSQLL